MKLQYQMSNGNWSDCGERTEQFLARCDANNGTLDGKIVPRFRAAASLTREETVAALARGEKLRNDPADWYSNCRDAEAVKTVTSPAPEMVRCSCGHTVPRGSVMSASRGKSCPDCYDRMSD